MTQSKDKGDGTVWVTPFKGILCSEKVGNSRFSREQSETKECNRSH